MCCGSTGRCIEGRSQSQWLDPYRELAAYLRTTARRASIPPVTACRSRPPPIGIFRSSAGWTPSSFRLTSPPRSGHRRDRRRLQRHDSRLTRGTSPNRTRTPKRKTATRRNATCSPPPTGTRRSTPKCWAQWLVSHVVSAFQIDVAGPGTRRTRSADVYVYRNTFAPEVTLAGTARTASRFTAPSRSAGRCTRSRRGAGNQINGIGAGSPRRRRRLRKRWTLHYERLGNLVESAGGQGCWSRRRAASGGARSVTDLGTVSRREWQRVMIVFAARSCC